MCVCVCVFVIDHKSSVTTDGRGKILSLDLEMNGLEPGPHTILELHAVLATMDLKRIPEEKAIVIHHDTVSIKANMSSKVHKIHTKSCLLDEVSKSTISMSDAESEFINWIDRYVSPKEPIYIVGNSVWCDMSFVAFFMPRLAKRLKLIMIDITTLYYASMVLNWMPGNVTNAGMNIVGSDTTIKAKDNKVHRAKIDVNLCFQRIIDYRKWFMS